MRFNFSFSEGPEAPNAYEGAGRARARARAKYPDMLDVFAFIPTLTFHVLFENDFLIVLALFSFPETPSL